MGVFSSSSHSAVPRLYLIPTIVYLVIAGIQPVTHLPTVPQTQWAGEKDDPRTGLKKNRRPGSLCLPVILPSGFKQPREAEPSRAPSCDRAVITTRWINTSVVKVK